VKNLSKSIAIGAALFTLGGIGCGGGGDGEQSGALGDVDAVVILQRPKRNDTGDIFQYTSYVPGARLVKISPQDPGNTAPTRICCDQAGAAYANIDISGYDISFDAKTIVFSGKLSDNTKYSLFLLHLDDGTVTQLNTDPDRDYVQPIFAPGNKIVFTTNAIEEATAQHVDEYERGRTTQLGRINVDGTGEELGPRNLSHRTSPSMASDGRIVFTQWDHLGDENSGHLMFVNQGLDELREGFGKEGTGASNSTLKAREISPGRFVAIATSRDRTLTAGALIDIRLGTVQTSNGVVSAAQNQSEANASYRALSPNVPMGNDPSAKTIGRYYDAFPLNAKDKPDLLVSWSDGPVQSEVLAQAGQSANFGIYLYSSERQQRLPIFDDPDMWDIFAQPLRTRSAPNVVGSAQDPRAGGHTLIGSLNVYDSSLKTFTPGSIYGVRVMEGFSSEEGFREDFGTREFEGHANLGVAKVQADGSWSAKIPANIPIHLQAIDVFGMSLFNEPVWFSGRAGEARMCGGCHEDRTRTTNVAPGQLDTLALGASDLMSAIGRKQRLNDVDPTTAIDPTKLVGIGWDKQIQPILNARCVECHGNDNKAGIAGYTIMDPEDPTATVEWTFNLTGDALPETLATAAGGGTYSKSYFSLAGPNMEAVQRGKLMIMGNYKTYMKPLEARESELIKKLNPTQLFPAPNAEVRAFPGVASHLVAQGKADLTPQEFYAFILDIDMGVNFYARENNPLVNEY